MNMWLWHISLTFPKVLWFTFFSMTFPGLEMTILKLHDFSRFSMSVRTLYILSSSSRGVPVRPAVALWRRCDELRWKHTSSPSRWPHAAAYLLEQFPLLRPQLLFPDPAPASPKSRLTSKTKRHIFLYESHTWGVGSESDGRATPNWRY